MAIVYAGSDSYHTNDDTSDAGYSDQYVRDGWWCNKLYNVNRPLYRPIDNPFGGGSWAHGRSNSDYGQMQIGQAVGTTFLFAIWFKHGGSDANCMAVEFWNQSDRIGRIYFNTAGTIAYQRNTTTLGTTTAQFPYGRWNHLAVKVLIDNASGTVDLTLNGTNELSLTSQDTYEGSAGAEITRFRLGGDDTWNLRFAQPIVWTTSGDAPTDLIGMHKVYPLYASADTAQVDWSPLAAGDNYAEVDDVEADDDTSYNESSTSTDEDRLDCDDLPETPTTIYAVQSRVLVKQTGAGNLGLKNGVYSGTTKSVGSERKAAIDYEYHTNLFTDNPDDSAAWAEADVNACKVDYEVG